MTASPAIENTVKHSAELPAQGGFRTHDRLTIFRLLAITAGIAVGLVVYSPNVDPGNKSPYDVEYFRSLVAASLIGACLPAGFFAFGFRRRSHARLGPGGLLALAMTTGTLLLLPPAAMQGDNGMGYICLRVTLPLMSLWYLVGMAAAGQLNRGAFSGGIPWSERYALYLAIAWLPEACWLIYEMYEEAF
ncbi:MAG: hypothetical protein K2Y37_24240 [Pirellulales bacterium]|nr:hypothetical protein [Pirellulales bacterium]